MFKKMQSEADAAADLVISADLHCCHAWQLLLQVVAAASTLQCLLSHLQLQQVMFCPALLREQS